MCTCGDPNPHRIARRETFDGARVVLWDNGAVTSDSPGGFAIPGVPIARPRTPEARELALTAGWLFMGECEIFERDELPALYAACRFVADRGGLPGDVRARVRQMQRAKISPVWTVTATDRDGRPTAREWRLPRLRWPGLAVIDRMSGDRYEVVSVERVTALGRDGHVVTDEIGATTGIRFATLDALAEHLHSIPRPRLIWRHGPARVE